MLPLEKIQRQRDADHPSMLIGPQMCTAFSTQAKMEPLTCAASGSRVYFLLSYFSPLAQWRKQEVSVLAWALGSWGKKLALMRDPLGLTNSAC